MEDYFEKYVAMCHLVDKMKKKYSESNLGKTISEKDVEIGKLKSQVEELQDTLYKQKVEIKFLNKKIDSERSRKNFRDKEKIKNQAHKINDLQNRIGEISKENHQLKKENAIRIDGIIKSFKGLTDDLIIISDKKANEVLFNELDMLSLRSTDSVYVDVAKDKKYSSIFRNGVQINFIDKEDIDAELFYNSIEDLDK